MAFGHFLLGSPNFMVMALWLMYKVALMQGLWSITTKSYVCANLFPFVYTTHSQYYCDLEQLTFMKCLCITPRSFL